MNIKDLWLKYKETEDNYYKQELIKKYIHLVKIVAGRLYNYHGGNVDYDDLLGYGVFGLIDAIEKFDINRNLKFETYAQIRIRGTIIDNLRKLDWVPRSLRKKSREFEEAINKLENKLGRTATKEEIASELNVDKKEVENVLTEISTFNIISLEELLSIKGDSVLEKNTENTPDKAYLEKEMIYILKKSIDELPYKEKMVISLYYYNELTYKEIGKVLGLSESRISQIHSKAIILLKNKIKKVGI
ncbi:FliA/WhiG family RNA polymerase sigma factor [Caldisalinibacter kiritimatiensis]|uniref:RNA polymerase sigma factor for flagellar operon n=1 Tax=Caldisalinibacter kiritimatiensis TaxID=1304284 RepID=R1ARE7_9FIRM|nr:FliA/WhiG family RNA polymerase sigma factor [Caldisalinibacter kiritimatiensis]EOC99732.1 RNA polymerase sigma factor for flagellar operon [Caldisalinibacter kiritimatiensis]